MGQTREFRQFFRHLDRAPMIAATLIAVMITSSCGPGSDENEPWSIILLPDTQRYTHNDEFNEAFRAQTQWIVDNRDEHNIRHVLHLGDIVDHNTEEQWARARESISILNGHVPYALAPGNHDYGDGGSANHRATFLNDYFSITDNPLNDPAQGGTIGGVYQAGELDSHYHTFRANGLDYLVVSLEWGPRDGVVEWANQVVARHPDHRAILVTHAYLYSDSTRYDWAEKERSQSWNPHAYGTSNDPDGTNDGQELWDKLVKVHPNFILTVNGHVLNGGRGFLVSDNDHGRPVTQMLFNTQFVGPAGDGWLRILRFDPDNETVSVMTYSPWLDEWLTDGENAFSFSMASNDVR